MSSYTKKPNGITDKQFDKLLTLYIKRVSQFYQFPPAVEKRLKTLISPVVS